MLFYDIITKMKKKILFYTTRAVNPPWDEASKNIAYNTALKIKNYTIILLTKRKMEPAPNQSIEQFRAFDRDLMTWWVVLRTFGLRFQKQRIHAVHFFCNPTPFKTVAAKLIGGKNVKIIKTIPTLQTLKLEKNKLIKALESNILIVYSEFTRKKLENIGVDNAKVIYPGVDTDKFSPGIASHQTRKDLGISSSDFTITYPGEYVRLGDTRTISAAIDIVSKKIDNMRFIIACRTRSKEDKEHKLRLKKHFDSIGLDNKIIFAETVPDMPSLFRLSSVVIFPAEKMVTAKFVLPLTIIEAMSCSRPVILSDIPELKELHRKHSSLIIAPGDSERLAQQILFIYKNPEKAQQIGRSARKFAIDNFNLERMAKQQNKLYSSLFEGHQ